jgi:hypothetical protein
LFFSVRPKKDRRFPANGGYFRKNAEIGGAFFLTRRFFVCYNHQNHFALHQHNMCHLQYKLNRQYPPDGAVCGWAVKTAAEAA